MEITKKFEILPPDISYEDALRVVPERIGEAVKILGNTRSTMAAMQFFELLDLVPVKDPDVQLRLNTRDGGSTVYLEYNPVWMARIDDPSILAYFFFAEVLRVVLHHCTARRSLPAQSQYLASNLLCFEDQSVLSKWQPEVKKMLSTVPTWQQIQPVLAPLGFNKSKDWFLEKLKAYIEKAVAQQKQTQQGQQGQQKQQQNGQGQSQQQGNGQRQQQQNGQQQNGQQQQQQGQGQGQQRQQQGQGQGQQRQQQGQGQGQGQGQQQQQDQSQGQGQGQGQNGDQSPEDGQNTDGNANGNGNTDDGENEQDCRQGNTGDGNASDCAKACQEYFDNSEAHSRKQTEQWGENTMVDEEVQATVRKLQANPEMWGSMAGSLQDLIISRNQPKFDPTRIVKNFKHEIQSELFEQSRSKANRRNPDLSGWRHKMKASMGFFTDVSGSMSDDDVAMGKAFMMNFIKHVQLFEANWDCDCEVPVEVKKNYLKKNGGQIEISGRGGTDPRCILDRLDAEHMKLGGIVVFTDCYFDWPLPPSKYRKKIFIISTADGGQPPEWCHHFLNIKDIRAWYDRYSA